MSDLATLGGLLRLARDTVVDPKEGANIVLSFAPPRQALWLMFGLILVVSVFFAELSALLTPAPATPDPNAPEISPTILGLLQAALLFLSILAVHHIGRAFGGTGQFEEAFLLMLWLQFILICAQVLQVIALLILPVFSGLIFIAAIALFFWLLVNFIAVLHGFQSLGQVFVMVIVTMLGFAFLLSLLAVFLGIGPADAAISGIFADV